MSEEATKAWNACYGPTFVAWSTVKTLCHILFCQKPGRNRSYILEHDALASFAFCKQMISSLPFQHWRGGYRTTAQRECCETTADQCGTHCECNDGTPHFVVQTRRQAAHCMKFVKSLRRNNGGTQLTSRARIRPWQNCMMQNPCLVSWSSTNLVGITTFRNYVCWKRKVRTIRIRMEHGQRTTECGNLIYLL